MAIKLANNAKSSTANAIDIADLQIKIQIADEGKFPVLAIGDWFYLTIVVEATYGTDSEIFEIVKVTARTLNTLDIERGAEGTTPMAFAVGDICEQRITMQTLIDLNTPAPVPKERIYKDEIYLQKVFTAIPVDGADLHDRNRRYAPKLLEKWDSEIGAKSKVLVQDLTNGTEHHDLQFDTLDEMVIWKNAQFPGNTQAIVAKPYDEIDTTIPTMTRMFNMNRFLAAGKGKRLYNTGKTVTASGSTDMESNFATILNNVIGTSFDGSETNMLEIVWFGRNTKNRYIQPPIKTGQEYYKVYLGDGSAEGRSVWDWGGSDISGAKVTTFKHASGDPYYYVGLTQGFGLRIIGEDWYEAENEILQGTSVMVAWKMQNTSDSNHVSMVMKPIGIDCIVIEQPDWTKYSLEFVYFNNDKQNYTDIKTYNNRFDFNYSDFDENGGQIRINSYEWITGSSAYTSTMMLNNAVNRNDLGFDTIYLRLRSKSTGMVGQLSPSYIEYEKSKGRIRGSRFMVKSQKKG